MIWRKGAAMPSVSWACHPLLPLRLCNLHQGEVRTSTVRYKCIPGERVLCIVGSMSRAMAPGWLRGSDGSHLQANQRRHCNLHPDPRPHHHPSLCWRAVHNSPRPHHHPSLCWRAMHNSTRVAILARQENRSTLIAFCMENRQATSPLLLSL